MEYPKNGSVVIIDDKIEDIEDLMIAFSKKNVPTFYFTGKKEKLHKELDNIKIIFLDVDYSHTQRPTKQTKVDYLVTIVTNLITPISSDYIIVVWSTLTESYHSDLEQRLQSLFDEMENIPDDKKLYKMPIKILSINKGEVKDTNGNFDLDLINKRINSVISSTDIMNLTIYWENNVLESAKNVLRNFNKIAPTEEEQKKIYALFADSISQSESLNAENIISPSLSPISSLLSDQLSTYINHETLNDIGRELVVSLLEGDKKLDINIVSKINTFYHVDSTRSCNNAPGTVYFYQDYMDKFSCSSKDCNTKWSENLLEKIFQKIEIPSKTFDKDFNLTLNDQQPDDILIEILKIYKKEDALILLNRLTYEYNHDFNFYQNIAKTSEKKKILRKFYIQTRQEVFFNELKDNTIPIFLEFSPDCDFVQGKRKKLRLIFGLMIPYNFQDILREESKLRMIKIHGDNIITAPIIDYNHQIYQVIFDLHTVTGINEKAFSEMKQIFRLRKELLVDIQQKIASHIARPGFFNMNDYLEK